jgi:hypothetical protein
MQSCGVIRSYLSGLTLSNDQTTPNSVIDIAEGVVGSAARAGDACSGKYEHQ